MTTLNIDTIELKYGGHESRDQGVCLMEAVAWFAGLDHTDRPECTDAVVAAYARALNDVMPDDQRQRLRPFISLLAGTSNGCPPEKRAMLCADRAVRVSAAAALRSAGLTLWADQLARLAPIVDEQTARAADSAAARAAGAAANDARAATSAAARAAGAAASAVCAAVNAASAAVSAAGNAARAAGAAVNAAVNAGIVAVGADPWEEPIRLLSDLIALKEEATVV